MPMRRRAFLASAAAAAATVATARAQFKPAVTLGDDIFVEGEWRALAGRGIGVITNQTGFTSESRSLVDALVDKHIAVKAIFAPEHGFRGNRPAGEYVASYSDPASGLPVYSLYGPTRHPNAEMLRGVDVLVFDIQDVGSRAYTYISTMAYAMQSAKEHGLAFWVLDRPNPVGGTLVEGPVLDPAFSSFIGLYPIPMRHGMTIGELAKLFNDAFGIGADLHVVPMRGYDRSMIWSETGLNWIRTSPNIPTWQTTFPYLCTGLIDNAGINNGVGTNTPFFYAGAYGLDGAALANRLAQAHLPGVAFAAASWSPSRGFWAGKTLSGVRLEIADPKAFLAVRSAVEILCAVREIAPKYIEIKEAAALDRDWGTDTLRRKLIDGIGAQDILASWVPRLSAFERLRVKYLLY